MMREVWQLLAPPYSDIGNGRALVDLQDAAGVSNAAASAGGEKMRRPFETPQASAPNEDIAIGWPEFRLVDPTHAIAVVLRRTVHLNPDLN